VKQKSVSLSTAERTWYSASEAGKELLYLRIIMRECGLSQVGPSHLYADSLAVICMAENPSNRKGARHIDTREHFATNLSKSVSSSWHRAKPTRCTLPAEHEWPDQLAFFLTTPTFWLWTFKHKKAMRMSDPKHFDHILPFLQPADAHHTMPLTAQEVVRMHDKDDVPVAVCASDLQTHRISRSG
jgi:hypothetical protein